MSRDGIRRTATLAIAGAALMVLAGAVGAAAATGFSDVDDDHVFADEIEWLAQAGITDGYQDGTFRPGSEVTRQAVASWLHRLAGQSPNAAPSVDAATVQGMAPEDLRGQEGPQGPEGPPGPVEMTQVSEFRNLFASETVTITAQCPEGGIVVGHYVQHGGMASVDDAVVSGLSGTDFVPQQEVSVTGTASSTSSGGRFMQVRATCYVPESS